MKKETAKFKKLESKKIFSIEDIARLNRPAFNKLIMERSFFNLGKDILEVFETINKEFFSDTLITPIILPAEHCQLGTCYNYPISVITLHTDLYIDCGLDAHLTLLHECIHLKYGLQQVDDGEHNSEIWVNECQRIFNKLNIKIDVKSIAQRDMESWPQATFHKYHGVWEYFKKSISKYGKLLPLPGGFEFIKKEEKEFKEYEKNINLTGDVSIDKQSLISTVGHEYALEIAQELLKK